MEGVVLYSFETVEGFKVRKGRESYLKVVEVILVWVLLLLVIL